ncbi:proline-rich protein HaeIII subfamily 1-like [Tympanuchus pallidicinctus]|uniref:proline-rich protein HaeIII subfamily 1-like n=1 Tax=Tympanuchus pallidicinctus TaxID=109042 RepID=UPI0022871573|nr:proline-rich protein HaeIII subfamily 1-like [Tympanuchus pallidicinctus]
MKEVNEVRFVTSDLTAYEQRQIKRSSEALTAKAPSGQTPRAIAQKRSCYVSVDSLKRSSRGLRAAHSTGATPRGLRPAGAESAGPQEVPRRPRVPPNPGRGPEPGTQPTFGQSSRRARIVLTGGKGRRARDGRRAAPGAAAPAPPPSAPPGLRCGPQPDREARGGPPGPGPSIRERPAAPPGSGAPAGPCAAPPGLLRRAAERSSQSRRLPAGSILRRRASAPRPPHRPGGPAPPAAPAAPRAAPATARLSSAAGSARAAAARARSAHTAQGPASGRRRARLSLRARR